MDAFDAMLRTLAPGGVPVIAGLLMVLFLLHMRILVFGWVYREQLGEARAEAERARKEMVFWRNLALKQSPALRESVEIAEQLL